jgi:chorismate-pyruvate lyase
VLKRGLHQAFEEVSVGTLGEGTRQKLDERSRKVQTVQNVLFKRWLLKGQTHALLQSKNIRIKNFKDT